MVSEFDNITGGENQSQNIAAATYLKNFTRRNTIEGGAASRVSKEFKDVLVRSLLLAEPAILKVLIEAVGLFAVIIIFLSGLLLTHAGAVSSNC